MGQKQFWKSEGAVQCSTITLLQHYTCFSVSKQHQFVTLRRKNDLFCFPLGSENRGPMLRTVRQIHLLCQVTVLKVLIHYDIVSLLWLRAYVLCQQKPAELGRNPVLVDRDIEFSLYINRMHVSDLGNLELTGCQENIKPACPPSHFPFGCNRDSLPGLLATKLTRSKFKETLFSVRPDKTYAAPRQNRARTTECSQ